MLIEYCKMHSIEYYISAIRDLPDQQIRLHKKRNSIILCQYIN